MPILPVTCETSSVLIINPFLSPCPRWVSVSASFIIWRVVPMSFVLINFMIVSFVAVFQAGAVVSMVFP